MEFSIDQLADLKIAIKKNEWILSEREKANVTLETRNKHLVETNNRLDKEITLQVDRIDEAKAKNISLSEEKEWILSKFAIDNEKVYKDLREKEVKISNESQQTALRLIELDKREWKLANKEKSNNLILEEARNVSKETKNEAISVESKLLDLEASKKNLEVKRKSIYSREEALFSIKKKLEKTRIENNDKEFEIMEINQANSNKLIQIQSIEKSIVSDKARLEKLVPLFSELKNYVIENSEATAEDIEKMLCLNTTNETAETINETVEETVLEPIIEEETITEEVKETEDTPENQDPNLVSKTPEPEIKEDTKFPDLNTIPESEALELIANQTDSLEFNRVWTINSEVLVKAINDKITELTSSEDTISTLAEQLSTNKEFDINTASYAEMLVEAKLRDSNFSGQPKKVDLVKLLSK